MIASQLSGAPTGSTAPSGAAADPHFDRATALVVVDVQNDFADAEGNLYVNGGEQIIPRINALIAAARAAGALTVYTLDWHPEYTPHFEREGGIWPEHCVAGSWGAELHPDLVVEGHELVLKGTGGEDGYSGFSVRDLWANEARPTELERILRRHGTQKVVLVGLATDWCVKESALDARRLGFDVTVDTRATRAVDLQAGDGERAIEQMRRAGVHVM